MMRYGTNELIKDLKEKLSDLTHECREMKLSLLNMCIVAKSINKEFGNEFESDLEEREREDAMDEMKRGTQDEEEDQADSEETVKDSDWIVFEEDANTDQSNDDEEAELMDDVLPS